MPKIVKHQTLNRKQRALNPQSPWNPKPLNLKPLKTLSLSAAVRSPVVDPDGRMLAEARSLCWGLYKAFVGFSRFLQDFE